LIAEGYKLGRDWLRSFFKVKKQPNKLITWPHNKLGSSLRGVSKFLLAKLGFIWLFYEDKK